MAADSQQNRGRELPGTVVKDILASDRRQAALSCLGDHGGEMNITDLAACVCAREFGTSAARVSDTDRQRVYDELYDEHLPMLTATGVATFDSLRDSVVLNEEFTPETGNR